MKRFIETLKKQFVVTNKDYQKAKMSARAENLKNLIPFSIIGIIVFLALFAMSFFSEIYGKVGIVYFVLSITMILCLISSFTVCKKWGVMVRPTMYLFMFALLGYGIVQGTLINPTELTVSYIVWLFAVSLLFIERPIFENTIMLVSLIVYIILARINQTDEMFVKNLTDVLPYGFVALILCSFMMKFKFNRLLLQMENQELIDFDQLTGLGSYSSYSKHIKEIKKHGSKEAAVISLDVNGLKHMNDTFGHATGDELIIAAARCIKETLSPIGKCYRNGGDEFSVLIEDTSVDIERTISDLRVKCNKHIGIRVNSFSLSIGHVKGSSEDIEKLIVAADKDMYADKKNYYTDAEDRRLK